MFGSTLLFILIVGSTAFCILVFLALFFSSWQAALGLTLLIIFVIACSLPKKGGDTWSSKL